MSDERASKSSRIDESLVDELMLEIFYRLPCAESVMQCKCVSKSWYNLISKSPDDFTTHFIAKRYEDQFKKGRTTEEELQLPYASFIYRKGEDFGLYPPAAAGGDPAFISSKYSLDFLPVCDKESDYPVFLKAWHSDLILCTNLYPKELDYYVCNPRTKQWLQLPPPSCRKLACFAAFTCDPYYMFDQRKGTLSISPCCRFRVFHAYPDSLSSSQLQMEVYSSETRVWGKATLVCPIPIFLGTSTQFNCFTYNGMLHCYSVDEIIGFDPYRIGEGGVIHGHYIQMPPYDVVRSCRRSVSVGVFRGKIRLVECVSHDISYDLQKGVVYKRGVLNISNMRIDPQDPPSSLKIWELDNYKTSEWSLKNEVFLHELHSEDFALSEHIRKGCPLSRVYDVQPNDADVVVLGIPPLIIIGGLRSQGEQRDFSVWSKIRLILLLLYIRSSKDHTCKSNIPRSI